MFNNPFGPTYQIELLYRQAMDAHPSGQFATMESLLTEAARLADEDADLATQIRIKYWLAEARRMQSRYEEALTTYAWLIGVANDPPARAELADNHRVLTYLVAAFDRFVACGRFLPAMPSAQLHNVIDIGLAFLDEAGRSEWAHGLRLQRGQLLKNEGHYEVARQELEAALALRRRDPNSEGYTLGAHLCNLGDLLQQIAEYDIADACYCEVWQGNEHSMYIRRSAAQGLAYVEKSRKNLAIAEEWARKAVMLAGQMQSAGGQEGAQRALIEVLLVRGKVTELVREGAVYWYWTRQEGAVGSKYLAGNLLAQVRLAMAQAVLQLRPNLAESLHDTLPIIATSDRRRATRYLAAAERWLARAQEPARQLDAQIDRKYFLKELDILSEKIKELQILLSKDTKKINDFLSLVHRRQNRRQLYIPDNTDDESNTLPKNIFPWLIDLIKGVKGINKYVGLPSQRQTRHKSQVKLNAHDNLNKPQESKVLLTPSPKSVQPPWSLSVLKQTFYEILTTALSKGKLLIIWGNIPWLPISIISTNRTTIIHRNQEQTVSQTSPIAGALSVLPPLSILSFDPTYDLIKTFDIMGVPLQKIHKRQEDLIPNQHNLLQLGGDLETGQDLLLTWDDVSTLNDNPDKVHLLMEATRICANGAVLAIVSSPSYMKFFNIVFKDTINPILKDVPVFGLGPVQWPSQIIPLNESPSRLFAHLIGKSTSMGGKSDSIDQESYRKISESLISNHNLVENIKPTIGIITALPKELVAVKLMLDYIHEESGNYCFGQISALNGNKHNIVLVLVGMGTIGAAIETSSLIDKFKTHIKYVIMVGIAGGVPYPDKPDEHVRLGDIVVLNEQGVIQYDFDKETSTEIEHRHSPRPPSPDLLYIVKQLAANELHGEHPWLAHIARANALSNAIRPAAHSDKLAATNNPSHFIAHPNDPNRTANQPRIFIAPIASGNKLLKNPKTRDYLRQKFSVKAIEMEAAGIAHAAWRRNVGYMVIRGICDYCDSHKNDDWQGYAAVVAAAYMRAMLEGMEGSS